MTERPRTRRPGSRPGDLELGRALRGAVRSAHLSARPRSQPPAAPPGSGAAGGQEARRHDRSAHTRAVDGDQQRRPGDRLHPPPRTRPGDDGRLMTGPEHDVSFDAMGSHVRLLIGEPGPGMAPAPVAAEQARRFVVEFEQALSRFRPGQRAVRAQRRPTRASPGLRAAAHRGQGRPDGGRAQRRPGRSDAGRGDRVGRLRRLAGRQCPARRSATPSPRRHRGARRAPTRRPPGGTSRSTTRPARSPVRSASASTPAAPARGSPPTS